MPVTILDLVVIGVVLISALLAAVRGFTREVLAIASWVVAGIVALMFYNFSRVAAGGALDLWFWVAVIAAAVMLFMLFRPAPKDGAEDGKAVDEKLVADAA